MKISVNILHKYDDFATTQEPNPLYRYQYRNDSTHALPGYCQSVTKSGRTLRHIPGEQKLEGGYDDCLKAGGACDQGTRGPCRVQTR